MVRLVQGRTLSSDDGLELFVCQLVDRHDFCQLLGVPCLVLHEVWDADVLHLSQCSQAVHIFKGHLSPQRNTRDRISNLLKCKSKISMNHLNHSKNGSPWLSMSSFANSHFGYPVLKPLILLKRHPFLQHV